MTKGSFNELVDGPASSARRRGAARRETVGLLQGNLLLQGDSQIYGAWEMPRLGSGSH